MGAAAYDAQVKTGSLDQIGNRLRQSSLDGPVVVVTDSNVAPLYGQRAVASLESVYQLAQSCQPAKLINHSIGRSCGKLWSRARTRQHGPLLGRMVSDLAGFAGAYLRPALAALPASLLRSMPPWAARLAPTCRKARTW
jgi:3-dehydroquinate synthetase